MYIPDDSDLKYDRYKTGKVALFGQPFLYVDLILSQNQIISFFTFFFSSEFSLMSNFS